MRARSSGGHDGGFKNDASDILPSLVSEELTTEQELRVSLEARWLWGRVFWLPAGGGDKGR